MAAVYRFHRFLQLFQAILEKGWTFNEKMYHFITSTFGFSALKKFPFNNIKVSLSREEDSFLELIFFPFESNHLSIDTDEAVRMFFNQTKRILFEKMEQFKKYEDQLKGGNMEILMARGIRFLHVDFDAAKKEMDWIDRLNRLFLLRVQYLCKGGGGA